MKVVPAGEILVANISSPAIWGAETSSSRFPGFSAGGMGINLPRRSDLKKSRTVGSSVMVEQPGVGRTHTWSFATNTSLNNT
jgi:hypothetical protein